MPRARPLGIDIDALRELVCQAIQGLFVNSYGAGIHPLSLPYKRRLRPISVW